MRLSRSVTRKPSGLESAIALVVSKRAARVGTCSRPNANIKRPRAPQAARAISIQERIIAPFAFGASQSAAIAPAKQRTRTASTNGLTVRSIRSTGGTGVDFIRESNPRDMMSLQAVRVGRDRSVLACSRDEVSAALATKAGMMG